MDFRVKKVLTLTAAKKIAATAAYHQNREPDSGTAAFYARLGGITHTPYVPLMGAYPIVVDNEIVGAVAVAGAKTGENDEIIAKNAAETKLN